jgi:alpha-1,6-mannosyltransferase
LKICDLTQFYSPLSGGVKRYVHEKIGFLQSCRPDDEHVLVVPNGQTAVETAKQSRVYSIYSPLISRRARYRALINLRALDEILERERPDIIESSDPYQVAWKAVAVGRRLRIPVVGFYHSHFAEAYLRKAARMLGETAANAVMRLSRSYVANLYNRFAATIVPSPALGQLLTGWGVNNVRHVPLGVNTDVFQPEPHDQAATRESLGIPTDRQLLLYVGRLAHEKNTRTLFEAFAMIAGRGATDVHLVVVGDGAERAGLEKLRSQFAASVTWLQYCTDSVELARLYRAADLFVHPGVQETFGLVALETQACGTPIVGIRGTHMDRIILHDQELWAQDNSAASLSDAITAMLRVDLAAIGRTASERVAERFSWREAFTRLFCIYEEVCAK